MKPAIDSSPPVIPALDGTLVLGFGLLHSRRRLAQRQQVPMARLRGRRAVQFGLPGLTAELPWPQRADDSPEPAPVDKSSAPAVDRPVQITGDQREQTGFAARDWPVPPGDPGWVTDPPAPDLPQWLAAGETPPVVMPPAPPESAPPAAPSIPHDRSIVRQMERVVAALIPQWRPPDMPHLINHLETSAPDPLSMHGEGEKAAADVPSPRVERESRGEVNLRPLVDRAVPEGEPSPLPALSWRETPPVDLPLAERLSPDAPPDAWIEEPPALLAHPPLTLITEVIEQIVRQEVRTEVQRQQIELAAPNRQNEPSDPGRLGEQPPADVRPAVVTDDETVRVLMHKMNTIAREDRFRRGQLR